MDHLAYLEDNQQENYQDTEELHASNDSRELYFWNFGIFEYTYTTISDKQLSLQ